MAFLIQCDNKGCMKQQAACLDVGSNDVICIECFNPITNVTSFAKRQLKSLGQTTKAIKPKRPYSVTCEHCSVNDMPFMDKDKILCGACRKELKQLSHPFQMMLKSMLGNEQE